MKGLENPYFLAIKRCTIERHVLKSVLNTTICKIKNIKISCILINSIFRFNFCTARQTITTPCFQGVFVAYYTPFST
ncbi:hypothetical protein DZA65_00109 [Dickeya dianthicola]|nr:hypothetical protein DZA65_00109 [Dickeya dianthicola]